MTRNMILAILLASVATPAAAIQTTPPSLPPACTQAEHRQFDFWLGRWDVYRTGSDKIIARSLIEKLYGGCAVRENWMPLNGSGGGSLNSYRADEKKWRQTWVDSGNSHADFVGGMVDGSMVIAGRWKGVNGPGTDGYVRITYSRQPDGSVRQIGEIAPDERGVFQPSFDFTYRPAGTAAAQSSQ